ncbi:orotidine-5'-phosphate decarboxylase [Coprothermobacter proteolyticus]|uniref:orotidine-5'-phosphate decarboxylase n=1 Tax=Coprothermobacter proteolyticus TaxID=35786 RepID=UPI000D31B6EE|nr:orotidine-5'-phosphate decarboxylase [Coprothermobacter proteolyticus]MBP8983290.1 orotidine-5'-phosphate decarboxylase [Coprothermobacter sp.]NLT83532.1 orotidine-5'-phosphate decarboxylase [Coprothermobacter proteolyticus]HOK24475.1 orotidine-5'-phosphate decarboxylase [Coprothermobacter proteolyticus]HOL53301.1 orotidine-5'-phosphate decarboxylase [Coprothermobacter proteolyticus]HOP45415.1 orotidine-5'-phosphate decarboxylase [Coprothermobacter proteolyticus]
MKPNLVLALDFQKRECIDYWIEQTQHFFDWYKVGMEAFYAQGDYTIAKLFERGKHIFLDLKLSDIPNTVYKATKALLSRYPIDMINVHALSGRDTLSAFKEALMEMADLYKKPIKAIGVTLLTSLSEEDLQMLGLTNIEQTVMTLAHIVKNAGLDGVVCSTKEAPRIKQKLGEEFLTVTPGIRFDQLSPHDQKRTGTLQEAVKVSDFIIIGRALTEAQNPQEAIRTLQERWEQLP